MGTSSANSSTDGERRPVEGDLGTEAHIWLMSCDGLGGEPLEACLGVLDTEERGRLNRLRRAGDRCSFVAAHALVRIALSHYSGVHPTAWAFQRNAYGKPAVAMPASAGSLRFNISHTRGLAACIIASGREVGVDVEACEADADLAGVAEQSLAEPERDAWLRLPPALRRDRFYEYWTLKEACLKALGTGLSESLQSVAFQIDPPGAVHLLPESRGVGPIERWRFHLATPTPGHKLAAAVRLTRSGSFRFVSRWISPDRLAAMASPTHRCHIFEMNGESYRFRESAKMGKKGKQK